MGWLRLIPEYSASLMMLPLVGAALLWAAVHFWLAKQNEFFARWNASISVVIGVLGIFVPMYFDDDFKAWVDAQLHAPAVAEQARPLWVVPGGELYLRACPSSWCPALGVLERGSAVLHRTDLMISHWAGWHRVRLLSGRYCALEDYDTHSWRCRKWQPRAQVAGWVAASRTTS